jgi:hypothetical protein
MILEFTCLCDSFSRVDPSPPEEQDRESLYLFLVVLEEVTGDCWKKEVEDARNVSVQSVDKSVCAQARAQPL